MIVGAPISSTTDFVYTVIVKVGHELVEQFVDRNSSFQENGDPCNSSNVAYRGVTVQQ